MNYSSASLGSAKNLILRLAAAQDLVLKLWGRHKATAKGIVDEQRKNIKRN